jgi:Glycosyl transferase family 2/Sulfotransferase domain
MGQPRVVMALKVRDEADVIESNLRFHAGLGVDAFVITDNGSVDGTREILARWERAGLAHVLEREGSFRRQGSEWLTEMARLAATELGADWVIHADADEFWWPLVGDLKQALASVPQPYGTVMAPRGDFVGRPESNGGFGRPETDGEFADRLVIREARSLLRPKVAHRGDPDVVVLHDGGHDVISAAEAGSLTDAARPTGRAVIRAVRPDEAPQSARLMWAPMWPLRIFHFPVRSEPQFKRRIELSFADEQIPDRGWSAMLREHYRRGRVPELYARLAYDDAAVAAGLESGDLVYDTRLRDMLDRCLDPLAGGNGRQLTVSQEPDRLAAERLEVQRDLMQALGRAHRATVIRLERARRAAAQRHDERNQIARERRKLSLKAERRRTRIAKLKKKLALRRMRIERLERNLARERSRPIARVRRALKRAVLRPRTAPHELREAGGTASRGARPAGPAGGRRRGAVTGRPLHETMWTRPVEVPECPPGWETGAPDFVGVGAQRSGSTWWFRVIEAHPGVVSSRGRKELHYFDGFWNGDLPQDWVERYHRMFPRPPGMRAGEWTPRYMYDHWTLPRLREAAPRTRVLVILRDPVERFRSGLAKEQRLAARAGGDLGLALVPESLARGRYHEQLESVLRHFDRDRVHVLQYERCLSEPVEQMNRTFGFLGLEPLEQPPEVLFEPSKERGRLELAPEVRAELVERLRDDVARLVELCPEIDVSLWPSFAEDGVDR